MCRRIQTIHLGDQDYVILPRVEYERLTTLAKAIELPPLPKANAVGNFPALEFTRALLARVIIRDRVAAGLSQKDLASKAGVRVETLCRLETGKVTPSLSTIKKIDNVLKQLSKVRLDKARSHGASEADQAKTKKRK
ncbi:MAG: helix-turn-helix domain-containing protein [Planctomycetia bacterium]|nr:helix-turn-helix domain-containing protein [Planctomycetia bacterium]